MRCLDGITASMNTSLSELRQIVKDRESWHAVVHRIAKRQTRLSDLTTTIISMLCCFRYIYHFIILSKLLEGNILHYVPLDSQTILQCFKDVLFISPHLNCHLTSNRQNHESHDCMQKWLFFQRLNAQPQSANKCLPIDGFISHYSEKRIK